MHRTLSLSTKLDSIFITKPRRMLRGLNLCTEELSSGYVDQLTGVGKLEALDISLRQTTSDQPATRVVIAQLSTNSEPLLTKLNQASENCASVLLFCRRYRGLLKPVRNKVIHPILPRYKISVQGKERKSMSATQVIRLKRIVYLLSESLTPSIIPDWAIVKIGHLRICASL
jgi:hypothetical protein